MNAPFKFFTQFLPVAFFAVLFFGCSKDNTVRRGGGGTTNPDVDVISDVKYGSNKNMSGNVIDLKLDVYMPAGATASQKFPFIFFVHGGGFTAGDKASAANALTTFAGQGFVGASIDYRVDSSLDQEQLEDPCLIDSSTSQRTVYMSIQDAKAAIRFLLANADKYHIDASRVFFDGNSAGAISILGTYFLNQQYFNSTIPGVENELGSLNNADNNIANQAFTVIGIAANSGCLPDPGYINSSNVVPMIFFNGGKDSVIPAKQGRTHYCPNSIYVYGSETLYPRVTSLGESAVIHVDPEGGHGPYTEDFLTSNEICFFNSILNRKVESGSYSGQVSSCP